VQTFRLLAPDVPSGIVSQGPLDLPVKEEPLVAAESCVRDLLSDGFASLGSAWRDRVRRVASECSAASLVWPAQILEELAENFDRYTARDAAFTPAKAVEQAGELLLRTDAIMAGRAPVPQAFIRGMRTDRDSDLGAARFIGLGASITETRRNSTLTVFLQDCDNSHMVTISREFAEDPDATSTRKPFHQLARATAVKDASMAVLAAGQLIMQGGRRAASGRLVIGRARAVVNPQNYAWEQLKAPVLVEDFAELSARLRLLPPSSFRPRRAAADFHVCPLEAVEGAAFNPATNSIIAEVRDRSGSSAMLSHPWTERGRIGAEALLAALASDAKPLFIAGHVRAFGTSISSLLIHPTAVVFAGAGTARRCVMPWLDATKPLAAFSLPPHSANAPSGETRYAAAAGLMIELVLNGLRRVSSRQWPGWLGAVVETEERGYHRMATLMRHVQESPQDTTAALTILKLLAMARDACA